MFKRSSLLYSSSGAFTASTVNAVGLGSTAVAAPWPHAAPLSSLCCSLAGTLLVLEGLVNTYAFRPSAMVLCGAAGLCGCVRGQKDVLR